MANLSNATGNHDLRAVGCETSCGLGADGFPVSGDVASVAVRREHVVDQAGGVAKAGQRPEATRSAYGVLACATHDRLTEMTGSSAERFAPLSAVSMAVREEYQQRTSKNGRFDLKTWKWQLRCGEASVAEVKMVLIEGSKNCIINTWVFPFDCCNTPVFAAELIALGGAPRLTFMDIQVPGLISDQIEQVRQRTADVRRAHSLLRIDEIPPAWAIDATAGEYLFTRGAGEELIPEIRAGYMDLLDAYLGLLASLGAPKDCRSEPGAQQILHAYQHHHMESSPGKIFLSKVFGEKWTEDFLTLFLFCLPGE